MNGEILSGCIVGAGFIGKIHASAYARVPGVRIAAVVDRDLSRAEELARMTGGTAYDSIERMYSLERPEFTDVCLPSTLHRDAVLKAFENGSDVVVEKPFALTLSDIDDMIEASSRFGKRLMVAHVCRFMPQYVYAKKLVEDGTFGGPIFFGCWRESETPFWSWNDWLLDRTLSGGTVMDLSIHDIDLSNWLLGKPEGFLSYETSVPGKPGPAHVVSLLTYPGGVRASVEAGHLMPKGYAFNAGYRLLLEGAVAEWHTVLSGPSSLAVFADGKRTDVPLSSLPPMTGDDPYAEELLHFTQCLRSGAPFRIAPEEARAAVETVHRLTAASGVPSREY